MAKCYCACGTAYGVPVESLGKKAKCRKCGVVFTLKEEEEGSGVFAIADEAWPDTDPDGGRRATGAAVSPVEDSSVADSASSDPVRMAVGSTLTAVPSRESRSYVSNVLRTFLFPGEPASLMSFLFVWFILVVGMFASNASGIFGLACFVIVTGWYCSVLFNILRSAAGGDDALPDLVVPTDIVGDLFGPLFSWLGSWLIVMIPAIAYLVVASQQGVIDGWDILRLMAGGLDGLWQGTGTESIVYYVLLCLGATAWPMVILCVVIGGFPCLSRVDLIITTIVRTFPVYVLTLALMFGAAALSIYFSDVVAAKAPSGASANSFMVVIMLIGVELYLDIVLVRLVGLYYHHFKSRFAWSWG